MNYKSPDAQRLFEEASIAEYAYRLRQEGWDISLEEPVGGGLRADLLARRGDQAMLVEFKRPATGDGWRSQLRALRDAAREIGASFKLVFLPTNERVSAEVADLDKLLFDALREDTPPDLVDLSADTRVDEVSDGTVERMAVTSDGIEVEGTASVVLTLHSGEGDEIDTISVPFEFEGVIGTDRALILSSVVSDLSVWYGDDG